MRARASDFPPPFAAGEFVGEPTDPADERIEVGVLIVGGSTGPEHTAKTAEVFERCPSLVSMPIEKFVHSGNEPFDHARTDGSIEHGRCADLDGSAPEQKVIQRVRKVGDSADT